MAIQPIEFRDAEAERRLLGLLEPAAAKLAKLGPEPVLVAQCPNKFNDAWEDDLWFAAQVGEAYWERSHFIQHRPRPEIKERGNSQYDKAVHAARNVLDELEAADWRHAAIACFGQQKGWQPGIMVDVICNGDVLCLALQYAQPWLCIASSNNNTKIACTWTDSGLVHMASCERIDQFIGLRRPLCFSELRADFWDHLRPNCRTRLRPQVHDQGAAEQLTARLLEVVRCLDRPVVPAQAESETGWWQLVRTPDGYCFDNGKREYIWFPPASMVQTAISQNFSAAVELLEKSGWQGLLAEAISRPSGDSLRLVRRYDELFFLSGLTAFKLMPNELRFAGLCNDVAAMESFELYDVG